MDLSASKKLKPDDEKDFLILPIDKVPDGVD